mmetsp:Transcript_28704/g.80237  ORF Transcript_28704/g.80237 Transcript_28704/m.80237 type:complete len:615 (+) Transcript_28704:516-2360(+)
MTTHPPGYQSTSLYVGDLAPEVSEGALFELFNTAGNVASIRVCRDTVTRRSLGYAYVNFHNPVDAERALDTLNNTMIKGRPCRIMWSQRDPSIRRSGVGNIFIKNLDKSIDHKALYDTFSDFGNILSCKVAVDEKGESKGYGFVHYETQDMADQAIAKVNGCVLGSSDKVVFVGPFIAKRERIKQTAQNFTNVFVKNLPEDATEEDIRTLFEKYGKVTSGVVKVDDHDKTKVFGFFNFENHEAARAACEALNNTEYKGRTVYVARAQKKAERQAELKAKWNQIRSERTNKGTNLYIKNLDDDMGEEALREEFAKFGNITSIAIMKDDKNNTSKGFGFVCFASPEEANKAISEMNGKVLGSKPLYVALAQRKEERRANLEAQYSSRPGAPVKGPRVAYPGGGQIPAGVYPGGAAPMFYQAPNMPQQFMYPGPQQAAVMRQGGRWTGPPQGQFAGQPQAMQYVVAGQMQGGRGSPAIRGGAAPPGGGGRGGHFAGQAAAPNGGVPGEGEPLTAEFLSHYSPEQQFLIVSQRLYPAIVKRQPDLAPKITGMIRSWYLEHNEGPEELLRLLEDTNALNAKIQEALEIWEDHVRATKAEGGSPAQAETPVKESAEAKAN